MNSDCLAVNVIKDGKPSESKTCIYLHVCIHRKLYTDGLSTRLII